MRCPSLVKNHKAKHQPVGAYGHTPLLETVFPKMSSDCTLMRTVANGLAMNDLFDDWTGFTCSVSMGRIYVPYNAINGVESLGELLTVLAPLQRSWLFRGAPRSFKPTPQL